MAIGDTFTTEQLFPSASDGGPTAETFTTEQLFGPAGKKDIRDTLQADLSRRVQQSEAAVAPPTPVEPPDPKAPPITVPSEKGLLSRAGDIAAGGVKAAGLGLSRAAVKVGSAAEDALNQIKQLGGEALQAAGIDTFDEDLQRLEDYRAGLPTRVDEKKEAAKRMLFGEEEMSGFEKVMAAITDEIAMFTAMSAATPSFAGKFGEIATRFASRFVKPLHAKIVGGIAKNTALFSEYEGKVAIIDAAIEGHPKDVAEHVIAPLKSMASFTTKLGTGRIKDITLEEWVTAGFIALGGILPAMGRGGKALDDALKPRRDFTAVLADPAVAPEMRDAILRNVSNSTRPQDLIGEFKAAFKEVDDIIKVREKLAASAAKEAATAKPTPKPKEVPSGQKAAPVSERLEGVQQKPGGGAVEGEVRAVREGGQEVSQVKRAEDIARVEPKPKELPSAKAQEPQVKAVPAKEVKTAQEAAEVIRPENVPAVAPEKIKEVNKYAAVQRQAVQKRAKLDPKETNKSVIDPGPATEGGQALTGAIEGGKPFKRSQAGFAFVPEAAHEAIETVKQVGVGLARELTTMTNRLRLRGTYSGRVAATLGERSLDDASAIMGQMHSPLDAALKVAGGGFHPRLQRELSKLMVNERVPGKNYSFPKLELLIQGEAKALNAEQEVIRDVGRKLIGKRGELFEKYKLIQFNPFTKKASFFRNVIGADGSTAAPRMMHENYFAILMEGPGHKWWKPMVEAFADASGGSKGKWAKHFEDLRIGYLGEGPQGIIRQTQAEFKRVAKRIPADIWVGGIRVPIMETNPYRYFSRLAMDGSLRLGFTKNFGSPFEKGSMANILRKQVAREGGRAGLEEYNAMVRALHGRAIRDPYFTGMGGVHAVSRGVGHVMTVAKSTVTSAAALPNVAEFFGAPAAFAGTTDLVRALRQFRHPQASVDTLEALGAVTKSVANLAFDPRRPGESASRVISEFFRRGFGLNFLNELQEKLIATVGKVKADRMALGKGTERDIFDAMFLGFNEKTARAMARGKGTAKEYQAFITRAPAKVVFSPLRSAERSMFENRRIVKFLTAFQTYAQGRFRATMDIHKTWFKATDAAIRNRNFKQLVAAQHKMVGYNFGLALSGTMQYTMASMLFGGVFGGKSAWEEAKDNPTKLALSSYAYAAFAGPYGAILRSFTQGNFFRNTIFPYMLFGELGEFAMGKGKYEDQPWGRSTLMLAKRLAPAYRIASNMLAITGLAGGTRADRFKMEVARRNFWGYAGDQERTDKDVKFSEGMKDVMAAFSEGKDPLEIQLILAKTMGESGRNQNSMRQSLRARKLLTRRRLKARTDLEFMQKLQELEKRIGFEALNKLRDHDNLLDHIAATFYAPGSSSSGRRRRRP